MQYQFIIQWLALGFIGYMIGEIRPFDDDILNISLAVLIGLSLGLFK